MLDDLKLICFSYITYNFDNFSHRYRYKKLKANVNYFGGFCGIFVNDMYEIDLSFLVGLIDSGRSKFLLQHKTYYSQRLMYFAQQRRSVKLINDMEKEGIKKFPSWHINSWWRGCDEVIYLYDRDEIQNYDGFGMFD